MNSSVLSWPTWKKKNLPQTFGCYDSTKGWIRQSIQPTLIMYGFFFVAEDYDYGFNEKSKTWALQEADRYLSESGKQEKDCEFVYFCSRGGDGFMDYRAVYVRFLDINLYETCITCERFSEPVKEKGITIRGHCSKHGECHPFSKCINYKTKVSQVKKGSVSSTCETG